MVLITSSLWGRLGSRDYHVAVIVKAVWCIAFSLEVNKSTHGELGSQTCYENGLLLSYIKINGNWDDDKT